jgi:hypothetical protein
MQTAATGQDRLQRHIGGIERLLGPDIYEFLFLSALVAVCIVAPVAAIIYWAT